MKDVSADILTEKTHLLIQPRTTVGLSQWLLCNYAQAYRSGRVFAVVDAAFAQRRKTLRSALAAWAGSPARAEGALRSAGIDPALRGERLRIEDFAAIAAAGRGEAMKFTASRDDGMPVN